MKWSFFRWYRSGGGLPVVRCPPRHVYCVPDAEERRRLLLTWRTQAYALPPLPTRTHQRVFRINFTHTQTHTHALAHPNLTTFDTAPPPHNSTRYFWDNPTEFTALASGRKHVTKLWRHFRRRHNNVTSDSVIKNNGASLRFPFIFLSGCKLLPLKNVRLYGVSFLSLYHLSCVIF